MVKHSSPIVRDISLASIDEPRGILRMDIDPDDLADLAESISEIGLLQPILVAIDGDRYEIVFGHRRFLASKKLGLSTIRAVAREMSQEEIGIARATENISRADLTPLEEAATYKNLLDGYGLTLEQVAKKMGKTPGTIRRRMDLLRMPPKLQKAVHKKQISITVAEELWPIADEASLDYYLIFAIENGCTKEVARQWAKDWQDGQRRSNFAGGEGGFSAVSPYEPRPSYVPCDICTQPVDLNVSKLFRTCPDCFGAIKKAMEVNK
jgi:ParB family chromosome partitioning protein